MNLQEFEFPKVEGIDMAFSTFKTIPELLEEAKNRDFYNGHTPYNKLFSTIFFSGGKIIFKKGIDEDFKKKAWSYCRSFMGSFEPSHEEKEAICAMLMSELIEPELDKS
jgi:hypothetical protein